jgi:hypothetical protein
VSLLCCYHTIRIANAEHVLKVEGSNADEVKHVSGSLMEKLGQQTASNIARSPWVSGSFYLAAIVILIALFLVVAKTVNFVVLPIVIKGIPLGYFNNFPFCRLLCKRTSLSSFILYKILISKAFQIKS